jgi:hypothetical protein
MTQLRSVEYTVAGGNVTITGATETVAVTSPVCNLEYDTARVLIMAWGQHTTGSDATGITVGIRRGTTTSGTLLTEANIEGVKIAAGGIEPFFVMAVDEVAGAGSVQYVFTLKQSGGTANGTFLQGGIVVFML